MDPRDVHGIAATTTPAVLASALDAAISRFFTEPSPGARHASAELDLEREADRLAIDADVLRGLRADMLALRDIARSTDLRLTLTPKGDS